MDYLINLFSHLISDPNQKLKIGYATISRTTSARHLFKPICICQLFLSILFTKKHIMLNKQSLKDPQSGCKPSCKGNKGVTAQRGKVSATDMLRI